MSSTAAAPSLVTPPAPVPSTAAGALDAPTSQHTQAAPAPAPAAASRPSGATSLSRQMDPPLLADGETVDLSKLVHDHELKGVPLAIASITKKRGKSPYLAVEAANETGTLRFNVWERDMPRWDGIAARMPVRLSGVMEASDRWGLQFKFKHVARIEGSHTVLECLDRMPETAASQERAGYEARWRRLRTLLTPPYQRLHDILFTEIVPWAQFAEAPAAKGAHHAWRGGLLAHTVDVAEQAVRKAYQPEYRDLTNLSLLVLGALVHDVGKVSEYQVTNGKIEMSRQGQLYNHILGGAIMVDRAYETHADELEGMGLTRYHKDDLLHLVASHHGSLAWGANVEPTTIEAQILHQADNASAKVMQMAEVLRSGTLTQDGIMEPPSTAGSRARPVVVATAAPAAVTTTVPAATATAVMPSPADADERRVHPSVRAARLKDSGPPLPWEDGATEPSPAAGDAALAGAPDSGPRRVTGSPSASTGAATVPAGWPAPSIGFIPHAPPGAATAE